jgi:hypothetical protein
MPPDTQPIRRHKRFGSPSHLLHIAVLQRLIPGDDQNFFT